VVSDYSEPLFFGFGVTLESDVMDSLMEVSTSSETANSRASIASSKGPRTVSSIVSANQPDRGPEELLGRRKPTGNVPQRREVASNLGNNSVHLLFSIFLVMWRSLVVAPHLQLYRLWFEFEKRSNHVLE